MLGERGSISVQCFEFLIGAEGGGRVLKRCLRGRWTKKKQKKKLTNVSLVCMYVGRKSEMSVFFSVFFPTEVIY